MKLRFRAAVVAACMLVQIGCGDDAAVVPEDALTITCGDGTHLEGTMCVADDPDDPDTTPPGPVTGLAAAVGGAGVTLTWTNPADADFDSVIVVRRAATPPTATPDRGVVYAVDDDLGGGDLVVGATGAATVVDGDATPGLAFYAVYARDTAGNWSVGTRVRAVLPVPAQTGQISISITGGVVNATVTQQPANYHLTAQAQLNGTNLTVTVMLTSGVARVVFNPKLVVTAANQGTVTGAGTLAGDPYAFYGPGALAPGGTRSRALLVAGATGGADPVVLDVSVVDHPMLIGSKLVFTSDALGLIDTGSLVESTLACDDAMVALSINNGGCALVGGALSDDGRTLYLGYRNVASVVMLDTVTWQAVGGLELASGVGSVLALAPDPTGQILYAVLNRGQHGTLGGMDNFGGRRDAQLELVRLDARTLTETGRLILHPESTGGTQTQAKAIAITADGTRAAIPVVTDKQIHIVDLAAMTEVDTDTVTAGTQPIDVSAVGASPRSVAFSPDGASLIVGYGRGGRIDPIHDGAITRVNTTTWAQDEIAPTPAAPDDAEAAMAYAPDGSLWVMRSYDQGVSVFSSTLATETALDAEVAGPGAPQYVAFSPDGSLAYVALSSGQLAVFDVATRTRLDLDGVAGAPISNVVIDRVGQHFGLVTPY